MIMEARWIAMLARVCGLYCIEFYCIVLYCIVLCTNVPEATLPLRNVHCSTILCRIFIKMRRIKMSVKQPIMSRRR